MQLCKHGNEFCLECNKVEFLTVPTGGGAGPTCGNGNCVDAGRCLYPVEHGPAPTPAEIEAIIDRHEQTLVDIQKNFGAAYSTRITQDKFSLHEDRATLLKFWRQK